MSSKIQLKRGTSTKWNDLNPTLSKGEPGYETDTGKLKIGDGINAWTALSYFASGSSSIDNENIEDHIGDGFLIGGSGISIDYNDNNNTLTVSATGAANTGDITFNKSTISTANTDQDMTITTNGNGDIYIGADKNMIFDMNAFSAKGILLQDSQEDGYDDPGIPSILKIGSIYHATGTMVIQSDGTIESSSGSGSGSGSNPVYGGIWITNGENTGLQIPGKSTSLYGSGIVSLKNENSQWDFNNNGSLTLPSTGLGDIQFSNGTSIAKGTYDNDTGGANGISLNCAVGYELNWQGGRLKSTVIGEAGFPADLYIDSPLRIPSCYVNDGSTSIVLSATEITFPNGTTQDTAAINVAVPWTANHTLVDGTRYLANDVVYSNGYLYKANYDNESEPVTNATYWTNIGECYRLNIDGRDIPNIPYPVKDVVQGTNISITELEGVYTINGPSSVQESASLVTTVFNKSGSPIPKFTAVYIDGGQGDQPTIGLAQANTESTSSKTYGITAEVIDNMTTGKVIVFGSLTGVNTDQFNPTAPTGNVNGTTLWLSPTVAGGLTTTKPSAANHTVAIGTIVRTHQNEGVVEVRIQNGFELEELHNVSVAGVVNEQLLRYNATTKLWQPYTFNINDVDFTTVPSTDPQVAGKLWKDAADGNTLKVSLGSP